MLLLRFVDGEAKMMSIPRDLYVPIAETGGSQKINAAYNGGPRRLVQTVQQSLGIPIHHYLEVDFVSFAKLVDSLGGITIDFPHPAFDRNSGLDVRQAGPVELDGAQALGLRALAALRRGHRRRGGARRHRRPRPGAATAAVPQGRVQRARAASRTRSPSPERPAAPPAGCASTTPSSLWEAIRFAWRLRSLDPAPVELPTRLGQQRGRLGAVPVEPEADAALAQFR